MNIFSDLSIFIHIYPAQLGHGRGFAGCLLRWAAGDPSGGIVGWHGWVESKWVSNNSENVISYSGICSLRQYICYWLNCTRWPFKTFENILKQIRICSLRDRRNVVPKEQDLHAMTLKQNRTFYYLCKILAPSPQCQPRTVTGVCHGWNFHGTQPFVEGCCL